MIPLVHKRSNAEELTFAYARQFRRSFIRVVRQGLLAKRRYETCGLPSDLFDSYFYDAANVGWIREQVCGLKLVNLDA
jgi:hypothetical protein